jgi:predicted ATPase
MAGKGFLKSIRLENFKAFKDTGVIPLKPLTILVGKNSSGKSTILKAILGCSQTARQPSLDQSDFRLIGQYTNLGTYKDTIHENDLSKEFSISFGVEAHQQRSYIGGINFKFVLQESDYFFRYSYRKSDDSLIGARFSGVRVSSGNDVLCSAKHINKSRKWGEGGLPLTGAKISHIERFDITEEQQEPSIPAALKEYRGAMKEQIKEYIDAMGDIKWGMAANDFAIMIVPTKKYVAPFTRELYYLSGPARFVGPIRETSVSLDHRLMGAIYVGPVRVSPKRGARLAQSERDEGVWGRTRTKIGVHGEDLAAALHVLEMTDPKFIKKFNENVKNLGVGESAKTVSSFFHDEEGGESESGFIQIMVKKDGIYRHLMDLGFGVGQVLPIVFQLSLRKDRLIILEQPELHLHPGAQAELGDLLKFSLEQGNQLLVETHSANLIERIRNLIGKGDLSNDDVNLIYIKSDSEVVPIGFNQDGSFTESWPEGDFFDLMAGELSRGW